VLGKLNRLTVLPHVVVGSKRPIAASLEIPSSAQSTAVLQGQKRPARTPTKASSSTTNSGQGDIS